MFSVKSINNNNCKIAIKTRRNENMSKLNNWDLKKPTK